MSGATSGAAYPDYIAFRTTGDDGRMLTVVAALEPENGARFTWATWYHELAPESAPSYRVVAELPIIE